ncbi:elongation factor P--(R)-beta-lysine ligase [Alteromonas sediminis]|uniref:Elongation factor P--(R)-beta-lysine ligase n=1 Tax=Alteromonas sediminis TaxID=2259342 RepID=A0A3N5XZM7_9ALTE|nr:elongation factor P--(R)-beta-lysine ligase [Alteromonas sediminis]RPJ66003.1 elongation factor P--(R)-beta-lysine ligase [Alteromonas sediminis]
MWQPTAPLDNLRKRAALLTAIRDFFSERNVLEVDTPRLSNSGVTDVHLDNFTVAFEHGSHNQQKLYLQTSPEYAMKRLLAAGSGCIYQITPAFRHEGAGRLHNPEFTLLEWYRVGFTMPMLIDEVKALLMTTLHCSEPKQITYQQAFLTHTGLDPLSVKKDGLARYCVANNIPLYDDENKLSHDDLLQMIFSWVIEPVIGREVPCVVTHFPSSQAALARLTEDDPRTAERFEVYYKGIELANGFDELTDIHVQKERFEGDNEKRLKIGKPSIPLDQHFLSALQAGLPACAGVALGIDRLLMLALEASCIDEVLSFPIPRA